MNKIGYTDAIDYIADEIVGTTESRDDIYENVNHYMESLLISVRKSVEQKAKRQWPRKCFKIEYDLTYLGGDYFDVGQFLYIPFAELDLILQLQPLLEGKVDEQVQQAFRNAINYDPSYIISYTLDEPVNEFGEEWKEVAV